jgi:hypothetical protein
MSSIDMMQHIKETMKKGGKSADSDLFEQMDKEMTGFTFTFIIDDREGELAWVVDRQRAREQERELKVKLTGIAFAFFLRLSCSRIQEIKDVTKKLALKSCNKIWEYNITLKGERYNINVSFEHDFRPRHFLPPYTVEIEYE